MCIYVHTERIECINFQEFGAFILSKYTYKWDYIIYVIYVNVLIIRIFYSNICGDCDHDSKVHRFMSRIQVHFTFIIRYVIYTLIMLCFEIELICPSNNVTPKMFGSLLVINYFVSYWLDYIFNVFMQREKLFKCLASQQLISVGLSNYTCTMYNKNILMHHKNNFLIYKCLRNKSIKNNNMKYSIL